MLNAAQQRFAEALAEGKSNEEAYRISFPKSKHPGKDSGRLMSDDNPVKPGILAEITRIRRRVQEKAGGTVLTQIRKRQKLCRIVENEEMEIPHVIAAIRLDNEMDTEMPSQRMEITVDAAKLEFLARLKTRDEE